MHLLILHNPISGAGRAREAAERLGQRLLEAGHTRVLAETHPDPPPGWLDDELADAEVLVVVGGDGTVRLAAEPARRTGTPLYQFPFGTENLFSREFGMSRSAGDLISALDRFEVVLVDLGRVDGGTFVLMASIGYDAEVVHDLAAHRSGAITRLSYVPPMMRQLRRWRPPSLNVTVDGAPMIEARRGLMLVANCRQYAHRLNPAARASMTDGTLDAVFLPADRSRQIIAWMARCMTGRHTDHPRLVHRRGRVVEIQCQEPERYQIDGDKPVGDESGMVTSLRLEVEPGVLPVLLGKAASPGPSAPGPG